MRAASISAGSLIKSLAWASSSSPESQGISPPKTKIAGEEDTFMAASMPPSGPSPGKLSSTGTTPGGMELPAGHPARIISRKTGSRRVRVRLIMGTPSISISALFLPPKREALPPASTTADMSGNFFFRITRLSVRYRQYRSFRLKAPWAVPAFA